MKLYQYVHCPFCVRVRMGLGFLGTAYESIVVPYDDEITPLRLTGKKMLPIITNDQGDSKNESLEILQDLDSKNILHWEHLKNHKDEIESLIDQIGTPVHSLCMPYWIWTPEFNEESRTYFEAKKSLKRGPFKNLVKNQAQFIAQLNPILDSLAQSLTPFYKSDKLTILDIMIAAHLWGLYIVPEFRFQEKIHQYLQRIKTLSHFNYHEDFWK